MTLVRIWRYRQAIAWRKDLEGYHSWKAQQRNEEGEKPRRRRAPKWALQTAAKFSAWIRSIGYNGKLGDG
jgi:hypothetical protein